MPTDPPAGIDPDTWAKALAAGVAATRAHVYADQHTCVCGFAPENYVDWIEHQTDAALRAALAVLGSGEHVEYCVFGARGGHDVELSNAHDARAFAEKFGGWPKQRWVGPWTPVDEEPRDG